MTVNKSVTEPKFWIRPIYWKRGYLKPPVSRKLTADFETVKSLLFNGWPSEEESDNCIINIFRENRRNTCKITDDCETMLLKDDNPQGYATTHRLLIVLVAKVVSWTKIIFET